MRPLKHSLLILVVLILYACAAGPGVGPGQLATRAIETRIIDADFDTAYRAASHAMFALGFTISHTEKESGILVGRFTDPHKGRKVGYVLLFGVVGALIDTKETFDVTLFLIPRRDEENKTTLRIQMAIDGKPKLNNEVVSRIWIVTQRAAMLEAGVTIPEELEEQFQKLEEESASAQNVAQEEFEREEAERKKRDESIGLKRP